MREIILTIFIFGCVNKSTEEFGKSDSFSEKTDIITEANNKFCLKLYSELKNKEKGNIFFSPYSISMAFAMVYEGARGKTAKEIQSVFHFPEKEGVRRKGFSELYKRLNKKEAKYEFRTANALWIQKEYKLLKNYIDVIKKYYGGEVMNVDFVNNTEKARKTINKWVEKKTNDKIKNLFPQGSLNPSSRLVITNAVYFKGIWLKQFDKKKTFKEDFIVNEKKIVKVPMMRITGKDAKFNYAETENLQILELIYEGKELSMLILLPRSYDLKSLENSLTPENLNRWRRKLKKQRVNVFIPKFTLNTKYILNGILKRMGLKVPFSSIADFSGITGAKDLFISSVIHQAFVDVNEEGTEAAAATGVTMQVTSAPRYKIFRANHPFIFIIQERKTGSILFIGRVVNPLK